MHTTSNPCGKLKSVIQLVHLQYGKHGLNINPPEGAVVVEPRYVPPLPDERKALQDSLRAPIGSPPLRDMVRATDTVAIVVCDGTRAMPSHKVLPVILEEIAHVPKANIRILNALGTHRPNTTDELFAMLGEEIVRNFEIVQTPATEKEGFTTVGHMPDGLPVRINSAYVEADFRITTGFIEPHFFAGYSGGPKLVAPGLASQQLVVHLLHNADVIGHPLATWGVLEGNPVQEAVRACVAMAAPQFSVHVTLNRDQRITGVYSGHYLESQAVGAKFVEETVLVKVDEPFDIVVTTNSGFPLDQNLYQSVKGLSAAARVVRDGGSLILASACSDGVPDHGNYGKLLTESATPGDALRRIETPGFHMADQWQVQVQAKIHQSAKVYLKSEGIPPEKARAAWMEPVDSVEETLERLIREHGPGARVCILPEGPQTIPTLAREPAQA